MNMNKPDLADKEAEIWGSTDKCSKVSVDIPEQPNILLRYCENNFDFKDKFGPEAYALFASRQNKQNIAREGFSFTLHLNYPQEFNNDVRLALSAWLYFGGLGARTRRGCGSLYCTQNLMSIGQVLKSAPYITLWLKNANDGISAWSYAVKVYRSYRQNRNKGEGPRPGRSKWPEADSLRKITGKSPRKHSIPITSPLPSFPRAALGMPIIFQFSPQDRDYEPDKIQITPKNSGRMSSPVITKAIYKNGSWYSAVIILPHDEAFRTELKLTNTDAEKYEIPPLKSAAYKIIEPMKGTNDAISGFEQFISGDFWKEAAE